jgi:hypothetical protein
VRNDGGEAVPEIRVREKKGCDDGTRELNEHDEEVRFASARPGSLTTCSVQTPNKWAISFLGSQLHLDA